MSLLQAFRAGFVRRWHSNYELAHTNDRIDAHAGRVARIILMWHPAAPANLLAAALCHDDGEAAVGDMKAPLKRARPDIAAALDAIEAESSKAIWGRDMAEGITTDGAAWLAFADRLDAFMWAHHHGADMSRDGWPECRAWLIRSARGLGCHEQLHELIEGVWA